MKSRVSHEGAIDQGAVDKLVGHAVSKSFFSKCSPDASPLFFSFGVMMARADDSDINHGLCLAGEAPAW